jgi:signal peptidase II
MANGIRRKEAVQFILSGIIIIIDQVTKGIVAAKWPRPGTFIRDVFNNDIVLLYHVRNKAIAFSLGDNVPQPFRTILFIIVPAGVLVFLVWYYFHTTEFSRLQRWAIAGIIGGGLSNIVDRVFRPEGVVDIVSVKIYGFLGMERWPTFNAADSSVVICCLILLFTMVFTKNQNNKEAPQ